MFFFAMIRVIYPRAIPCAHPPLLSPRDPNYSENDFPEGPKPCSKFGAWAKCPWRLLAPFPLSGPSVASAFFCSMLQKSQRFDVFA